MICLGLHDGRKVSTAASQRDGSSFKSWFMSVCVEFAFSLWVLQDLPTIQKHAKKNDSKLTPGLTVSKHGWLSCLSLFAVSWTGDLSKVYAADGSWDNLHDSKQEKAGMENEFFDRLEKFKFALIIDFYTPHCLSKSYILYREVIFKAHMINN